MNSWINEAIFYHIFPLGFCGSPHNNDFTSAPVSRIKKIEGCIDHILDMEMNSLYLGPVFESSSHGYDTADYRMLDRRLGTNRDLKELSEKLHKKGIRLVLDGVFHHCGRDFKPFRDLRDRCQSSTYRDWFSGIDFSKQSPYGDPYTYDGWNGHYNLVKFNPDSPELKDYLFKSIRCWINEFGIDGLRLDAADSLDFNFMKDLSLFCRKLNPDFWLMGEVIHGDYRKWAGAGPGMLDSATNYEVYKGLWSSHNDENYFEIAYSLNRLFGNQGIYRDIVLYNFADNHDVERISSKLKLSAHIYPLYILLFSIPGIPSVYYGSEWGIKGVKTKENDWPLRPDLENEYPGMNSGNTSINDTIKHLCKIRRDSGAIKYGNYLNLFVDHRIFAFARDTGITKAIICVSSSDKIENISLNLPRGWHTQWKDLINQGERFDSPNRSLNMHLYPCWGRILVPSM